MRGEFEGSSPLQQVKLFQTSFVPVGTDAEERNGLIK